MQLMYVDESGDAGREPGSTPVFVLAGLITPANRWNETEKRLIDMRRDLGAQYGLKPNDELRGSAILRSGPGNHARRVALIQSTLERLGKMPHMKILLTVVRKAKLPPETDVFRAGWSAHLGRFDGYLNALNRGRAPETGIPGFIVSDDTHGGQLDKLVRGLRRERPVRVTKGWWLWRKSEIENRPLKYVIEQPQRRDSKSSLLIQAADLCAYAVYQREKPHGAVLEQKANESFLKALGPNIDRIGGTDSDGVFVIENS